MDKYATYGYQKNIDTGEVKKVSMHEEKAEESKKEISKTASLNNWIKITNPEEEQKIESSK